jgi:hypothetical protein
VGAVTVVVVIVDETAKPQEQAELYCPSPEQADAYAGIVFVLERLRAWRVVIKVSVVVAVAVVVVVDTSVVDVVVVVVKVEETVVVTVLAGQNTIAMVVPELTKVQA